MRSRQRVLSATWLIAASVLTVAAASISIEGEPRARRSTKSLAAGAPYSIVLEPIAAGLTEPVYLTHAGDGSQRLFLLERAGHIWVIKNGILLGAPYLDLTPLVESEVSEQGLLGLAFDPEFESNGTLYVNYTARLGDGDTVIARYIVSQPTADVAAVVTSAPILIIDQPQAIHNGGQLAFGLNDGYLYIGTGDGGGVGDTGPGHAPEGNAQSLASLLGKILRIHVRDVLTYTIPESNPFVQTSGARLEIWAYGLRNPWRFSFDRANGDMYIGDVGHNQWEEIDYQPASSSGGINYGWRIMEGPACYPPGSTGCDTSGLTAPFAAYSRGLGCAVIGGYRYRGSRYPVMNGAYFFGDFCFGTIWTLEEIGPGVWTFNRKYQEDFLISSFGEDESGELYVLDFSGGRVFRIGAVTPHMYLPVTFAP